MIHVVTSREFDFAAIAREAQAGHSPTHMLLELSRRVEVRFHQPGRELRVHRRDRLPSRLFGSPAHWALAREVMQQAAAGDTVYCTGEDVGIPLARAKAKLSSKARLAVTVHNINRPRARLAMKLLGTGGWVDAWLTPAQTQADFLLREMGVPAGKVRVVPEQTDTRFYTPGAGQAGKARPVVVSVGLEQRDYKTLAAATHDLEVDVKISGFSKDARAMAEAFPDPMPANMSRKFYEWRELVALYRNADVVVVPLFENRYVAGITTLLEALACRRPVILARTEGMAAYADSRTDEGRAVCRTVPPGDAAALRAEIGRVLADRAGAEAMAEGGYRWLLAHHTPEHWLSAVTEALKAGK